MIEELALRIERSPLAALERRIVAALSHAGLDPSVVAGALRLVALRRIRPVRPSVVARLVADFVRRGRSGPQGLIRVHAQNTPDAPAIVAPVPGGGELRLSYGDLEARIHRVAWGLLDLGVWPRDRVALMLHNGVEQIEMNAALGWVGASAVQVGWRLKSREVAYLLADAGARALVFDGAHAAVVEDALSHLPKDTGLPRATCVLVGAAPGGELRGFTPYARFHAGPPRDEPPLPPGGGYGGVIVYTSGTTGRPKGASRDFRSMGVGPILNLVADLPMRHDERHLLVCPLYHSAGAFFSGLVIGVGGTLIIHEQFDPEAFLDTVERERITSAALVPTMLSRLLALGQPALRRRDTSSLRWLMSVAAPLPTELARRVEEAFGPILYNFYAATETGVVTLARPGEHTARPGTIGRAVLGADIRLLDDGGRDVPAAAVGEMWVRSTMLVGGYHKNPEATAAAQRGGYFSVGDLARVDADGYYYLADRKSDMVISGGVNIYPWEIEQRLHEHAAVADCAVVGYSDGEWGESLAAFVVLREGERATAKELARFVTDELADYKRPRRVLFVSELPRNPTGKILKGELRQRLCDEAPAPLH